MPVTAAASEFFCGSFDFPEAVAFSLVKLGKRPPLLHQYLPLVPKEMTATEKSLGCDTLLFCAPEVLFISKWRAAFN